MPHPSVTVNSRAYTIKTSLENERTFQGSKNYLFDLSYLSCLDVIGDHAKEFLQGQLTCDTREVSTLSMRQGISCDLKGRILSLLDIVEWHGVHLILPSDLLEKTQSSLAKTALLSKVKLNQNQSISIFGFVLNDPTDLLPGSLPNECYQAISTDTYCCYRLSSDRFIILTKTPNTISEPFVKAQQWRGSLLWHELQLKDQQFEIYPESRGLFLPHHLGLHKTQRISFNKGCYKGQEIIARMHYLAKEKHQLVTLTLNTNEHLQSGKTLLNAEGDVELGELIDYSPLDNNAYLLSVCQKIDNITQ